MGAIPRQPTCKQVIDILPEPFVIIDREYRILAANRAYLKHYGRPAEKVIGRRCHEVSHRSPVPCSRNGEHCPLETVFATGEPTQVLHVHYDDDGEEERVQLSAAPLLDENGEVMYMGESMQVLTTDEEEALLVGRSRPLLRMTSLLRRVAPTRTSVLLLGESGVGKERAAEYVHRHSERADAPFIVVDCSVLGEQLIESELFGHERGAFTGATHRKKGLFEAADGGSLFIDEIGELPLSLQAKLLRALETGTVRPLGGIEYLSVDVRVIAATNRDLAAMVHAGTFREDLYYRLSAFPVRVPTLLERHEDIARLAEHFLAREPDGARHLPLSEPVLERLLAHAYPGNARELRNVLERAAILAGDGTLRADHIRFETSEPAPPAATDPTPRATRLDAEQVRTALSHSGGHRARAARLLGVSERTVYRYLQRMGS